MKKTIGEWEATAERPANNPFSFSLTCNRAKWAGKQEILHFHAEDLLDLQYAVEWMIREVRRHDEWCDKQRATDL